ncbi:accessory factor UbiK family protein [Pelagibacteraceae bacterium]|nr:accessory factor UbiK family protein [Pelagibacteraceae bacterium]
MVNRNKILSDLSKFAVDAMSAFSGVKEEIETIVALRVDKVIKKMNLVKKDEFEVLKKMVQKLSVESDNLKNTARKKAASKKKVSKKPKTKKKSVKR